MKVSTQTWLPTKIGSYRQWKNSAIKTINYILSKLKINLSWNSFFNFFFLFRFTKILLKNNYWNTTGHQKNGKFCLVWFIYSIILKNINKLNFSRKKHKKIDKMIFFLSVNWIVDCFSNPFGKLTHFGINTNTFNLK